MPMKLTSVARVAGAVLLAAVTTLPEAAVADASQSQANGVTPEVMAAMKRDLGLDAEQAKDRLQKQSAATMTQYVAKGVAGSSFAGAWFDAARGKLVVGLTDAAKSAAVRSLGAEPQLVANTADALDATKAVLDRGGRAPSAVTGWYVDHMANAVVVTIKRGTADQSAKSFLDGAKAAGPVKVVESDEVPRLLAAVRGGDAYYINNTSRCSVGFAVSGGFISAGHCGNAGDSVTGVDRSAMGTFERSSFPGRDYSYVKTLSSWASSGTVNHYGGADVAVTGSTEAAIGAAICRSGSTTGWHCGTIDAKNQTVNYAEGSVSGLSRTNVCAEAGDSGGSWISGSQAQGVTSGGSGDCTTGGTTYFQPVNAILSAYRLTLTKG
jgi:hypothetical protein